MTTKLITFFLFGSIAATLALMPRQPGYPEISQSLVFQRIDGVTQNLEQLKGKPVMVTFWSPNCVICMHEVDELNKLYGQLKGGEKFELLALSMYYDRPDLVIQSSKKMKYPVYFDLQKTLSRAFGNIVATPTSFLLNSSGEIIYKHAGRIDFAIISQQLKELIG